MVRVLAVQDFRLARLNELLGEISELLGFRMLSMRFLEVKKD